MLKKFTIFGERCSGTNYLEDLITRNFDVELTWEYSHKHFFGFNEYPDNEDTLFICTVRDPIKWVNSFFREKHHLIRRNFFATTQFLHREIVSYTYENKLLTNTEIMHDRNMHTGERYKNVLELRNVKLRYLLDELPNKVKNYIFIRYEDLMTDFSGTMEKIRAKGLKVKDDIEFPINTTNYKKQEKVQFKPNSKKDIIRPEYVLRHPFFDRELESRVGYNY